MATSPDLQRTMLTLAAITYRGINLILPEPLKLVHLRALMDECMAKFSPVKDKWKIVWGPVSFSATSPGFDDALMYVAQNSDDASELAVAIRGTNPLSVSDWVFGDLMVTGVVPWTYAKTAGAMISASAAIGLGVLQQMRWNDAEITASLRATAAASTGGLSTASRKPASNEAWGGLLKARLSSSSPSSLLETITDDAKSLVGNFNPLALLGKGAAQPQAGTDLKSLLKSHVTSHPAPRIYVTGHSKGGMLSAVLALWLADTRGPQSLAAEVWDPGSKAVVYSYSFAGPTAGNAALAAHFDDVLGRTSVRVWNTLDVVPRAFVPDDMNQIPALYNLSGLEKDAADRLVRIVADEVRALGYRQTCGQGTALNCALVPNLTFPLQVIHQHLDSYLDKLGLLNEMCAASLLAPVL
ncbi:MAG TPA: hypothetical protein VEK14_06660 [Rhodomicrobium sp.]|nr:hypothetical protein [Rhodomicrobium sp.]